MGIIDSIRKAVKAGEPDSTIKKLLRGESHKGLTNRGKSSRSGGKGMGSTGAKSVKPKGYAKGGKVTKSTTKKMPPAKGKEYNKQMKRK